MESTKKNNKLELPSFMDGSIIQQYHGAEDGALHASNNGYSHWYIDGANYEDSPSQWSNDRIEKMLSLMSELQVKPIYHGNFKVPLASDVPVLRKAAVEYLKKEIDLSSKLGAPLILHGGGIVEPRYVKDALNNAIESYVETVQEAKNYADDVGVELWLENLSNYRKFHPFYYVFTNINEYRYVLDSVKDIKMIYDVCHEKVGGGDPVEVFSSLHDRIAAFSFSDTDGQRDSHWPLGVGSIDFDGLTRKIIEKNWNGFVAFETRNVDPKENIKFVNELYRKHSLDLDVAIN
ncbi:sugar phosphate isomerase/epimerase [Vibrio kanaloae]|uniref:sugar phosphate isomerase/epimerase family protein n=1 Tax=Vibrio kanaloae TaxID=170673 RepID=UPI0010BE8CA7|nr:sugar phosphate isomerase/epimerase family protein [Vibrio kanaloae]TKF74161.1 sugar phosphate isomerase/epimerase [Vibrio kanaloae]